MFLNSYIHIHIKYGISQGQLQDPSISVDSEEVGQGEVSLLGGDISILRPVQLTAPAPTEDILRAGPGVHPLVGQVAVLILQGRSAVCSSGSQLSADLRFV